MTQRISKAGRRYTEGSSSTSPDCYPRVCERCSRRILVSRESFENRCDVTPRGLVFRAWHLDLKDCSVVSAVADTRSGGGA